MTTSDKIKNSTKHNTIWYKNVLYFCVNSGLLVGYLFLKALDKVKGKIRCMTLVLYYVHRFLR